MSFWEFSPPFCHCQASSHPTSGGQGNNTADCCPSLHHFSAIHVWHRLGAWQVASPRSLLRASTTGEACYGISGVPPTSHSSTPQIRSSVLSSLRTCLLTLIFTSSSLSFGHSCPSAQNRSSILGGEGVACAHPSCGVSSRPKSKPPLSESPPSWAMSKSAVLCGI